MCSSGVVKQNKLYFTLTFIGLSLVQTFEHAYFKLIFQFAFCIVSVIAAAMYVVDNQLLHQYFQ